METTTTSLPFIPINFEATNQIVTCWKTTIIDLLTALTVTSDIFSRNTKKRGLLDLLQKLDPFVPSDQSRFFLFKNGGPAQSCIVELSLIRSKSNDAPEEINIVEMYDNPQTIFQEAQIRRNLTINCIQRIKKFAKTFNFPKITISANTYTDEAFFEGRGFKKYDPQNPDIMTFYTNGFFPPGHQRKFKWDLLR